MTAYGRQRTKGLILNKTSLIGGRRPTPAIQPKSLNGNNLVETGRSHPISKLALSAIIKKAPYWTGLSVSTSCKPVLLLTTIAKPREPDTYHDLPPRYRTPS